MNEASFPENMHAVTPGARLTASLDSTYKLSGFNHSQQEFMQKKYIGKLLVIPDRFYSEANRNV